MKHLAYFYKPFLFLVLGLFALEFVLRDINLFYPLERPHYLMNTYENLWLEGYDWLNGATRLYIYKSKPGAKTYGHPFRVNQWGFRGGDFLDRKIEGWDTFRILVLGDSITAGSGIAEEDRYTELLKGKLDKAYPDIKFEVINLGVQGFETLQEYKILQRMRSTIGPNLIIVGLCPDDPNISYKYYPQPLLPRLLRERSILFRLLDPACRELIQRILGIPSHEDEVLRAYVPGSDDWRVFENSVRGIAEIAINETAVDPIAIFLYDVAKLRNVKDDVRGKVQKVFEKYHFIWVEVKGQNFYEPVSRFENHPNEKTHAKFAQVLFESIMKSDKVGQWQKLRNAQKAPRR